MERPVRTMKYALMGIALAAAGSAQAAGIGLRAGTTGLGADVAWSIAPTLSARLGYSALSWNHNVSTNISYDGKLKLSNVNALLDFSPLGPFRLTGGFIFNNNKSKYAPRAADRLRQIIAQHTNPLPHPGE